MNTPSKTMILNHMISIIENLENRVEKEPEEYIVMENEIIRKNRNQYKQQGQFNREESSLSLLKDMRSQSSIKFQLLNGGHDSKFKENGNDHKKGHCYEKFEILPQ